MPLISRKKLPYSISSGLRGYLVESGRELALPIRYDDLVAREFTQSWITLNCVSNPVGGDLAEPVHKALRAAALWSEVKPRLDHPLDEIRLGPHRVAQLAGLAQPAAIDAEAVGSE